MDHTLVNEHIRWGLIVVTYMFLSGVGAGSLIVAVLPQLPWFFDRPALLRLRRAAIISAAACFVVVPLAVIADLGQPWRMWRVLLAPHLTSAMPYGSYTLLLLTALIFLNCKRSPGGSSYAAGRMTCCGACSVGSSDGTLSPQSAASQAAVR
jgi:Ni/Fe-hydrogenase subunit HybB-like protein